MSVSIGELARRFGISVDAVRYYERAGVLPEPERNLGGQRRYGEASADALDVVLQLRAAGFSLEQIRGVVAVKADGGTPAERIARMRSRVTALEAELDVQAAALRRARRLLRGWREEMDAYEASHDHGRPADVKP